MDCVISMGDLPDKIVLVSTLLWPLPIDFCARRWRVWIKVGDESQKLFTTATKTSTLVKVPSFEKEHQTLFRFEGLGLFSDVSELIIFHLYFIFQVEPP